MYVYNTAPDIILHLKQFIIRLEEEQFLIGELLLNLCDPLAAVYYNEIESLGYIFNGILPATNRGTFITLVYLNGIKPSFDDINLAENNGQELLYYIRSDYEKRFC